MAMSAVVVGMVLVSPPPRSAAAVGLTFLPSPAAALPGRVDQLSMTWVRGGRGAGALSLMEMR